MATSTGKKIAVPEMGYLPALIEDWERALVVADKAPRTQQTYLDAAQRLVSFLVAQGMPLDVTKLGREHLEAFTADQLAQHKPSSGSVRYRALAQLWKWLADEGEVNDNPFKRMKPPIVPEEPVPVIGDDDLRRLLAVCEGTDFEGRRDTALIRVLLDCGVRAAEVMGLTVDDLDRKDQVVVVLGKGRRPRSVPYGAKTAQALDRYLRARARHSHGGLDWLWVSPKGRLTEGGLRQMLMRRSHQAGISPHVHPHQFRHTAAHRWLAADGQEVDAMALFGWKSRAMLSRYGASAAVERARNAHRRKSLGDRV